MRGRCWTLGSSSGAEGTCLPQGRLTDGMEPEVAKGYPVGSSCSHSLIREKFYVSSSHTSFPRLCHPKQGAGWSHGTHLSETEAGGRVEVIVLSLLSDLPEGLWM